MLPYTLNTNLIKSTDCIFKFAESVAPTLLERIAHSHRHEVEPLILRVTQLVVLYNSLEHFFYGRWGARDFVHDIAVNKCGIIER